VDVVCEARKNGRFRDINEFTRRVDLRKVGKRALECLIRVGALDSFGERRALLGGMDTIAAISESHFRARESGQLSIFGTMEGLEEEIRLPAISSLDPREKMEWEKELLGMYLSDHPLSAFQGALKKAITHYTGQLMEAEHQSPVVVGGMIVNLRITMTRKGQEMAFAILEDIQGTVELVIFPRTWANCQKMIRTNEIMIARGKVDTDRAEAKVLVDSMEVVHMLQQTSALPDEAMHLPDAPDFEPYEEFLEVDVINFESEEVQTLAPQPAAGNIQLGAAQVLQESVKGAAPRNSTRDAAVRITDESAEFMPSNLGSLPNELIPDTEKNLDHVNYAGGEKHTVVIQIKSTGDKERDNRRLSQIYGVLTSIPGKDQFAFVCRENGSIYRLDFPNDSTSVSPALVKELKGMVGEVNVSVE
jgi:DNA polymerase-3 subunit alpha